MEFSVLGLTHVPHQPHAQLTGNGLPSLDMMHLCGEVSSSKPNPTSVLARSICLYTTWSRVVPDWVLGRVRENPRYIYTGSSSQADGPPFRSSAYPSVLFPCQLALRSRLVQGQTWRQDPRWLRASGADREGSRGIKDRRRPNWVHSEWGKSSASCGSFVCEYGPTR